ncbi:hypothetical protein SBA3_2160011 [Candidatus Sulfopaludibacter sp. SbA3]|nr:hypothetical protein SBA3_2160011 [Candidatus Sulfopaludibacter sp. SbA3]
MSVDLASVLRLKSDLTRGNAQQNDDNNNPQGRVRQCGRSRTKPKPQRDSDRERDGHSQHSGQSTSCVADSLLLPIMGG